MQVLVPDESDAEGAHHSHSTSKQEEAAWGLATHERVGWQVPNSDSGIPNRDLNYANTDKLRNEDSSFQLFLQATNRKKRRLSSIMLQATLHPITGDVIGSSTTPPPPLALTDPPVLPPLMELCFRSLLCSNDAALLRRTISSLPRDVLIRLALFATTGCATVTGVVGLIETKAATNSKALPIVTLTPRQANTIMDLIRHLVSSATTHQAVSFGDQQSSATCLALNDDETLALRYCQLVLSRYFKRWDNVEDVANEWITLAEVHRCSGFQTGTRTAELFYIHALIQLGMATREQRDLYRSERLLQHAQELCLMRLLHAFDGTSPTSLERSVLHSNEELLDLAENHRIDVTYDSFARKIMHLYLSSYQHLGLTQMANGKPEEAINSFETAIRTWNAILSPLHATQPMCQCCSGQVTIPAAGKPGATCLGLQYNLFLLSLAHRSKRDH